MPDIQISNKSDLELFENEIIPVYQITDSGEKVVDGRKLHDYLKVTTRFRTWVKRRIEEYGFQEGADFSTYLSESNGGRPSKEYVFNLDAGKELGMVEKNEEGRRIRNYFIEIDKKAQQIMNKMPETYPEALRELAATEEEKQRLKAENQKKEQIIGELKPKADYTDKILQSDSLVTITQIAKDYGMSGQAMNKKLHELEVQYKQGGQWLLYSDHQGKGYTHSETIEIDKGNGETFTKMYTKWTQKGRLFLYNLLKEHGVLPTIEQKTEAPADIRAVK